ncbi:MAG: gliding motility lipoprotein GldD [Flavobacteriaceae bacterium]
MIYRSILLIFIIILSSCKDEIIVPKPKAFLSLKYPNPSYSRINELPFGFDLNNLVKIENIVEKKDNLDFKLNYSIINASLYLNYVKIDNNFNELISQNNYNLNNHAKVAIKASKQDFSDENRKVYGTLYELIGPVASPSQFYVTDSIDNFLAGTLFFKIKPNYDSLLPAINYAKNDIIRLIESIKWNN